MQIAERIREKQTDTFFRQLKPASVAIVINIVLLAYGLWNTVPHAQLTSWMVAILVVTALRMVEYHLYRAYPDRYTLPQWHRSFLSGVLLSSLLWGAAAFFFFPPHPLQQAFLLVVLAGVSAGATSSLSSDRMALYLFLVPTLLPLIVRLFLERSELHILLGMLTTLFLALLLYIARRFHALFVAEVRSRFSYEDAAAKLADSEGRLKIIFNEVPTGIFYYNADLIILEANRAFSEHLHAPLSELIGLDMHTLSDRRVLPTIRNALKGRNETYEGTYTTKISKLTIWIRLQTSPIYAVDGSVAGAVGIVNDITEQMRSMQTIRHQAHFDALTELPNRILLNERLEQALIRFRRRNLIAAALFMDLDHFKEVNDTFGHAVGDTLLREAAKRIQALLREEDTLARFGGDEFVILLPDLSSDSEKARHDTEIVAQKVLHAMQRPFENVHSHTLLTTVSIGIAMTEPQTRSAEDMLKFADTAMYEAKQSGRDRSFFYNESMRKEEINSTIPVGAPREHPDS